MSAANYDKLAEAHAEISNQWDNDIIPQLIEYIRIPNKSPAFDANWKENGHMDQAMTFMIDWAKKQPIKNLKVELLEAENRTPLLLIDIPGQLDETILLYGHMDKQPEMKGWDDDLGPWKPVIKEDKLYGRGGADDGYAMYASLAAITLLQRHNIPHARCIVLIEASEESGSIDLPYYLKSIKTKIGTPNLVICLDSECGDYEQLWGTTSIRGLVSGALKINVLTEGIHSGSGSGIVPSTFSILRELLDRIEDKKNNQFLVDEFQVEIPAHRRQQAQQAAASLGDKFYKLLPFIGNTKPVTTEVTELILNKTWRPALSVIGLDGLPHNENAGNVTIPDLEVKLSVRIPPTCNPEQAAQALKSILEQNPPHQAEVTFELGDIAPGWHAPKLANWLRVANDTASNIFFNKPAAYLGIGGSIPFMGMLGDMYPEAQFFITGVLGPKSNAHGPNEFLHIPYVKKITGVVAAIIAAHFEK